MTIQVERYYPTWTLGDRIRKARLTTGMNQRVAVTERYTAVDDDERRAAMMSVVA